MRLQYHAAASLCVSGTLYAVTGSWTLFWASLIAGIFIDLDHIMDFVMANGIRFNINEFFDFFEEKKCKTAVEKEF